MIVEYSDIPTWAFWASAAVATILLAFSLWLVDKSLWWRAAVMGAIGILITFARGTPLHHTLGLTLSIYTLVILSLAVGLLSAIKSLRLGYAQAQSVKFMKHVSNAVQMRVLLVVVSTFGALFVSEIVLVSGFGKN